MNDLSAAITFDDPPFWSASSIVAVAARDLAPLVPGAATTAAAAIAERVCAKVHTACFECRLSGADERCDFAFNLFPDGHTMRLVEAVARGGEAHPAWARTASFLRAWATSDARLSGMPFVCLAFEASSLASDLAPPCVSLCVESDFFLGRLGLPARVPDAAEVVRMTAESSEWLTGRTLSAAESRRIGNVLTKGDAHARHVSFMLPRPGAPMKLDVRLPTQALPALLEEIWARDAAVLHEKVRALVDWEGPVQVNLDLSREQPGALELELFTTASDATSEHRARLLSRLVEDGHCSAQKANVLRRIHSVATVDSRDGRVARAWYLKLKVLPTGPLEAKAYVGLMPSLFSVSSGPS